MDSGFSTLHSLAELGIGFAGFSALAGVIGDRTQPTSRHNLARLLAVVYASLVIVVSAYVPIVATHFGASERLTWQLASAVALPLNWLGMGAMIRLGRRSGLHGADRLFTCLGYPLEVIVEIPLFINLFGLLPEQAFALFLTSLLAVLGQTIVAFVVLVTTLLRPDAAT